jgi:hypothetical protein
MDQMKGAADDPEQFRTSRKKPVTVVKANIDDALQRDLRRARQSFAQRERERLGLAPRAESPERKAPSRPVTGGGLMLATASKPPRPSGQGASAA